MAERRAVRPTFACVPEGRSQDAQTRAHIVLPVHGAGFDHSGWDHFLYRIRTVAEQLAEP